MSGPETEAGREPRLMDDSIEAVRRRHETSVVWAEGEVTLRVSDALWRAKKDVGLLLEARAPVREPEGLDGTQRLTWTIEEAGRLLGIGRNGAYDAARRGDIPSVRIGRRLVVPRAALAARLTPERPAEGLDE